MNRIFENILLGFLSFNFKEDVQVYGKLIVKCAIEL
jgi:hypothetical protein